MSPVRLEPALLVPSSVTGHEPTTVDKRGLKLVARQTVLTAFVAVRG